MKSAILILALLSSLLLSASASEPYTAPWRCEKCDQFYDRTFYGGGKKPTPYRCPNCNALTGDAKKDEPSGEDPEREPVSEPTKPKKKVLYKGSSEALLDRMYKIDADTTYAEMDCTKFVAKALELAGFDMTESVRKRIFMNDVSADDIRTYVDAGSKKIRGVAGALVESGQATNVASGKIKPGDVVQYWYETKSGSMRGHAGIVEKSYGDGVVDLYGSHKSKGGVGTLKKLDLSDMTKAWIARPSN